MELQKKEEQNQDSNRLSRFSRLLQEEAAEIKNEVLKKEEAPVELSKAPSERAVSRSISKNTEKVHTQKAVKGTKSAIAKEGIDYSTYKLTASEKLKYLLQATIGIWALGFVFYKSVLFCLILTPFSFFYLKHISQVLRDKRKKALSKEFSESIYMVYTALSAGRSLEQAFKVALTEMDKDSFPYVYDEFELIVHRIDINDNVEEAVMEFADRSGVEDIQDFADILVTSKRTEGDIIKIIKRTTMLIGEKADIVREIDNNIAQKKLEQKILLAMPVFIILFLGMTSKGYLDPLYDTGAGRIAMSIALVVMVVCYKVANKITDIKI